MMGLGDGLYGGAQLGQGQVQYNSTSAGPSTSHNTPNPNNNTNSHSQAQGVSFGAAQFDLFADEINGAGPSSQPFEATHDRRGSRAGSLSMIPESGSGNTNSGRSASSRGRARKADPGKTTKRKSLGSSKAAATVAANDGQHGNNGMDLDMDSSSLQAHAQALWGAQSLPGAGMGLGMQGQEGQDGMEQPSSGGFGVPIGVLQQVRHSPCYWSKVAGRPLGAQGIFLEECILTNQLEGFHMQSPLVFDPKTAQAYSNLLPFLSDEAKNGLAQGQLPMGMNGGLLTPGECRQLRIGVVRREETEAYMSGPSGDMFPQFRMDGPQMSPMTLEMLARNENMEAGSSEVSTTTRRATTRKDAGPAAWEHTPY